MICVYKEHEIKTKKLQEQWLQLKIKFSLGYKVITWKVLFSGEDGELTFGMGGWGVGGARIKIWWEEGLLRDFPRWGKWANFSSRKTNIYIIVPACVLIPLANHNSVICSVPQGTKKLNKLPQPQKALIIPLCCPCSTITLILISEKHKNMP